MRYLDSLFYAQERDGMRIVERFPRFIRATCDLFECGELDSMTITVSFMFSNGGATYQVVERNPMSFVLERTHYALEEVAYG